MRRFLTWVLITLGIAALVRKLRRRGHAAQGVAEVSTADPAEELRRKLAETREPETPATPLGEAPSDATVEERRADVHDQGRTAIDEMRSSSADE